LTGKVLNKAKENIRDSASINELMVLSNLESVNSLMIKEGLSKSQRHKKLKKAAEEQLNILNKNDRIKAFKKLSETTYIEAEKDAKS